MGEEVYDDANHCWHFSKIQNWIGMWTSNSVSRHIPKEWKAKTLVDACILIHSNTVAKGRGSHCVHWWKTHCSDYVQECSDACGNVYALWRKGQLWKGKYYMVLLFLYIYMVLLIKGTLCGPAHKDRELNTGCHGLEERLTKTYSLMDLHFQFWECCTMWMQLTLLRCPLTNGCGRKFWVYVFYHIFIVFIELYLSSGRYMPNYLIYNSPWFLLLV